MKNYSKLKKWNPREFIIHTNDARESVRPHRAYIDNEYFEKGYASFFPHSTTTIYLILAKFANNETQICWPAAETVMALAGITNRNTYFRDIKLLKTYNLIRVGSGSKGRVPNVYVLVTYGDWLPINRDNFNTVMEPLKRHSTVSPKRTQQYQNESDNSDTVDTENHINNSEENFEIKSNFQLIGKQLLERLSAAAASVVTLYFAEDDIITALGELYAVNKEKKFTSKEVLEILFKNKATPTKELPSWLRI